LGSLNAGPVNEMPIGSRSPEKPAGTTRSGKPVMFARFVPDGPPAPPPPATRPGLVDDVLHTFVTIATYDTIGRKLCDRYGGVVTNCEFSVAVKNNSDRERLRQLASDIQSEGVARARRTILGAAA